MITKLTKEEFEAFAKRSEEEIANAYETLVNVDKQFSTINDFQGNYQAAIAESWINNYARAVQGFANFYTAVQTAKSAVGTLSQTDQSIAQSRG